MTIHLLPPPPPPQPDTGFEPLVTFKEAAEQLGLPYFKIQRAARAGLIPTYSLLNSRRYVRVSELIAQMSAQA